MTISSWTRLLVGVVGLLAAAGGGYWYVRCHSTPESVSLPPLPPEREATAEQVQQFCGVACHAYPPPDSFPRWAWRKEVTQGFTFGMRLRPDLPAPALEEVITYYEKRAPLELPLPTRPEAPGVPSIQWQRRGYSLPGREPFPEVVNVNLVRFTPTGPLEILVCECDPLKNEGQVLRCNPHVDPPAWQVLGKVPAPAHAELVDLDGDGHADILVACLGRFFPSDEKAGSVVWLRGRGDGTFTPLPLLSDVGRVADVQAADFNGDGKLDLVVAEFGWRETGSILLLENRTTDWSKPQFVPRVLDDRHGTIHVPVADLNRDGKPDFVALISQEHETVVAFLNEGEGRFRKEVIHAAPHPAYGSSGIQLADVDGDGDLDVLYTNGDVLDKPFVLKPYHGVHWLENRGTYPFTPHRLTDMPGVTRAVAADVDGDGDLDILAVSYLPAEEFTRRDELALDSVLWLEQTRKGTFVRRPLETKECDHFTCAIGPLYGAGKPPTLVVGNFWSTKQRPLKETITLWNPLKNQRP